MLEKIAALNSGNLLRGFRVLKSFNIDEFKLFVVQMHHEKSGANLVHLFRDDPNRAFSVQFRTTPSDSTGVSHILEHTVLCGSQKYPVRDPFMKMLRRSQATFMNAYTANDWTMYPFSTMNSTDYENLLSVYVDAAFFPKLTKLDFMQEGWRLEPENLTDSSSKLILKGVVYNEMKGVFSNSLNHLAQVVENNLLPVSYGYVSGGHPDCIPNLTWKDLKKFHSTFYHPSNANFYTYGNMELDGCLEYLDAQCLSKFDAQDPSPKVPLEPRWTEPRRMQVACQPDSTLADPTRTGVVSVSFALIDICDIYTNFALAIATSLLIDGDSAPLYQGLIESGLGVDWASPINGMDRNNRTTCFHVGLQGVRPGPDTERVERTVMEILENTIKTGFQKERIEAVLHQQEIALKQDNTRFGLSAILGLAGIVNHGGDIQRALSVQQLVDTFKSQLVEDPHMLEKLIDQYLVKNPHRLSVIMVPDETFETKQKVKEAQRQERAVKDLTPEKREVIIKEAIELAEEQKSQENEDVSCLPSLGLVDIPPNCRPEPFTETDICGSSVQLNEAPTNGLVYFHTLANISDLSQDLLVYVPVFTSLFSQLGADGLTYQEMDLQQELNTGTLSAFPHAMISLTTPETEPCTRHVHISSYCLSDRVPKMLELVEKRLRGNDWLDRTRIATLLAADASGQWSANALSHDAHRFAMRRASANLNSIGRISELWGGVEQAAFMRHLAARLLTNADSTDCDRAFEDFINKLRTIADHLLLNPSRLRFSLHAEQNNLAPACQQLEAFLKTLPLKETSAEVESVKSTPDPTPLESNSAHVALPYSVHYTSLALPAPYYTSPDFPAYRVLSKWLHSSFLHTAIREQGGAYGGGSCVNPGRFAFYSYRDPSAGPTLKVFEKSLDFALSTEFKQQDIVEAKLSVFQELDSPVSAGSRGLNAFLTTIGDEERQNHRELLFKVDEPALKQAAQCLRDQLASQTHVGRAVLGPKDAKLEQDGEQQAAKWNIVDLSQFD